MAETKCTIMMVDDDIDFIDANKILLEQQGYNVLTAHNSKECMNVLPEHQPDLMIIDVMMDYKSEGFDLARDLRHSEEYTHIPLIMLTSVNSQFPYEFEPHNTWLPVDVFLEKPVDSEQLISEVNNLLKSGK